MRQLKIAKSITNRADGTLDKYLRDISKYDMITQEKEIELATRIQLNGDKVAIEELVNANLRFVVSVAKQYSYADISLLDLINEGNMGMMIAAKKFDPTRGFKFISYAVWWIRQTILAAISDQTRVVRLPSNQINDLNKIKSAINKYLQNGYEPSIQQLADDLAMPIKKINKLIGFTAKEASLDKVFGYDGNDGTLKDLLIDNDAVQPDNKSFNESLARDIGRVLETLTKRESYIITKSYNLDGDGEWSLDEIAYQLGLTRERVRQIQVKSLEKLKSSPVKRNVLKAYLG